MVSRTRARDFVSTQDFGVVSQRGDAPRFFKWDSRFSPIEIDARAAAMVTGVGEMPGADRLHERTIAGRGAKPGELPWAGAAWHDEARALHLLRDPLGHAPLFYLATQTRIAAGTSPRLVLRLAGVRPNPNLERLAAFCFGARGTGRDDYWCELRRVLPGEHVVFDAASERRRFWWDCDDPRGDGAKKALRDISPASITTGLLARLRASFDGLEGPVTLALSGGTDSILLAGLLAERDDIELRALHLGSDTIPSVDESTTARLVASELGIPLERIVIDSIGLDRSMNPAAYGPRPFPTHALDVLIRERSAGSTLVTGIGGDQLFSGSPVLSLHDLVDRDDWLEAIRLVQTEPELDWVDLVRRTVRARIRANAWSMRRSASSPSDVEQREPWMKASAWLTNDVEPTNGPLHRRWEWEDVVRNAREADRSTGVTSLHPFTEPQVWRYASSIPDRFRHRAGVDKWVLREAIREIFPERIARPLVRRPKTQSFNAWAVEAFLRDERLPAAPHALARLGALSPVTFRNRLQAFLRVARGRTIPHETLHVVALWRTLFAERWTYELNDDG